MKTKDVSHHFLSNDDQLGVGYFLAFFVSQNFVLIPSITFIRR